MWKIPQGEYLYLKYLNGEIRPCGDHNLMGSYSIQKDPNFYFFFPKRDLKWLFPSLQDTSGSEEPCDGLVPLSWRVTVWMCCRWVQTPRCPGDAHMHQELCLVLALSWLGHILCGQCPRQWSWACQVMPPSFFVAVGGRKQGWKCK